MNVLLKSDKDFITTAGGKRVNVEGMINVTAIVADCNVKVKFYLVKNLLTDFILGFDFLVNNDVSVDFGKRKLSIDPRREVICSTDVNIPARSETVIVANIKGSLPNGVTGIVTSDDNDDKLLHGKTLCNINDGKVLVRMANLGDQPYCLKEHEKVGKFVCLSKSDKLIEVKESNSSITSANETTYKPSKSCQINSQLQSRDKKLIADLVDDFADIFTSDGTLGQCDIIEHEIHVNKDQTPIRQRAYRLSHKQKEIMTDMINDLLDQDIIQESTSPWSSPCMLVAKKNNGYRFVCDFRALNAVTKFQALPLPTVEEALDSIGTQSPVWFSSLDLCSGFFQLKIKRESQPYTAFRTHMRLYEFKRLPQGLANSPGSFQRVMEAVLRGLSWKSCLIYLDDVIIFSKTIKEHVVHLQEVFERLRSAGLKLKAEKMPLC